MSPRIQVRIARPPAPADNAAVPAPASLVVETRSPLVVALGLAIEEIRANRREEGR